MFQLPSLSWFFSILATHFSRHLRTRALACGSPMFPSSSAKQFRVEKCVDIRPKLALDLGAGQIRNGETIRRAAIDVIENETHGWRPEKMAASEIRPTSVTKRRK